MKLADISVFFPVFKISSLVLHSTPRHLTAFEAILLDIADQFNADATYGNYQLVRVFEEILGVPEPDKFARTPLEQMISLGVLTTTKSFTNLEMLTVADLQLTDFGRQTLEKRSLPGDEKHNGAVHYFDPIRRIFLENKTAEKLFEQPQSNMIKFEEQVQIPVEQMQHELRLRSTVWFPGGSEVHRVEHDRVITYWQPVDGNIMVYDGGHLKVEFEDKAFTEYFNRQPADIIYNQFLRSALAIPGASSNQPRPTSSYFEVEPNLDGIFDPRHIYRNLKMKQDDIHFLRYHPAIDSLIRCQPNTLTVLFEHMPSNLNEGIQWDGEVNGAVIYLDERLPIDRCFYMSRSGANRFFDHFELKVGQELFPFSLGYSLSETAVSEKLESLCAVLDELLDVSENPDHQLIRLFWMPVDAVWERIHQYISEKPGDPLLKIQELKQLREKLQNLSSGDVNFSAG